jgi:hypothetical protein
MSENAEHLKKQADRCARLAAKVTDLTLAKTLRAVAADYLRQAASMAGQQRDQSGSARGIEPTGDVGKPLTHDGQDRSSKQS